MKTLRFNQCVRNETDLLQLQLLIARRADEIAQGRRHPKGQRIRDRDCWLAAEQDVLTGSPPAPLVDYPTFWTRESSGLHHVNRT